MTAFFNALREWWQMFRIAWDVERHPREMTRYMRQLEWEARAGSVSAGVQAERIRAALTAKKFYERTYE